MAAACERRQNEDFSHPHRSMENDSDSDSNNYGLPEHLTVDNTHIKELARFFIMNELRKNGYKAIANQLQPVENPNDNTHQIIRSIAAEFENERSKQFTDIFAGLSINDSNLKQTYNTVLTELFREGVHWGKIIAFLVFSSHLAIYCAQNNMEDRVKEVVEWSELEMQTRIHDWVQERGGWVAFAQHYNRDGDFTLNLSSIILLTGVTIALIGGGLFTIKQLFS